MIPSKFYWAIMIATLAIFFSGEKYMFYFFVVYDPDEVVVILIIDYVVNI